METITNRKLNLSGFKPLVEMDLLTENQFSQLVKSGNFEAFNATSLSKYLGDIQKNGSKDEIVKAKTEIGSLIPKTILLDDGTREVRYLKAKVNTIVDNLETLSKGFKEKFESKMKEWKVDDIGGLKEKYSEEEQKKFWEEVDSMHTSKKEAGKDEDNPDGNNDATNIDNNEDGLEKQNNPHNEEEKGNEEETSDLEDDEVKMLMAVQELLEEGNEVDFKDLSEEEGYTDDETKKVLLTLKEKGYIKLEDVDNNGNLNVTDITREGKDLIASYKNNNDDNDDDNNDDNNDEDGDEDEKPSVEGKPEVVSDDTDEDEENEENEENEEEEEQEEEQEDSDNKEDQQTERELKQHAKNTSTDELEEFVGKNNVDEEQKQIAQEELENRKNGGENNEENNNEDNNNEDGDNEDNQERQEFDEYIDKHFEEHDISDLVNYTKKLIFESPSELKVLKSHYRDGYPGNHGGNKQDKIDDKEFNEYIDEFLESKPFTHLKDYTVKLLNKNPKAFKELKGKYKELKDSNMM